MSNNSISDKLLSLWANNKLAHFYIIQPSPMQQNPREFSREFMNSLLAKIIAEEKKIPIADARSKLELGISDILQICKEDENENYSVNDEQFSAFFRFQNFRPLELKQRFITIDDAHSITNILSNKLLKTLEEPAPNTTIFLIDPYRKKILPTIESRAIYIRVATESNPATQQKVEKLSTFLEEQSFKENIVETVRKVEETRSNIMPLFDALKGKKSLEAEFVDNLTQYVKQRELNHRELQEFFDALKWYQQASTFNNYSPEKLSGLLLAVI